MESFFTVQNIVSLSSAIFAGVSAIYAGKTLKSIYQQKFKERQLSHVLDFIEKIFAIQCEIRIYYNGHMSDYFFTINTIDRILKNKEKEHPEYHYQGGDEIGLNREGIENFIAVTGDFLNNPLTPKLISKTRKDYPIQYKFLGNNQQNYVKLMYVSGFEQEQIEPFEAFKDHFRTLFTAIFNWGIENKLDFNFQPELINPDEIIYPDRLKYVLQNKPIKY